MPPRSHHPDPDFATTLAHGLALLQCFRMGETTLSNKALAERTGLSKATVSRLTYTLAARGLLQYDADLRRYRLGSTALALAYPLLASLNIRQIARSRMARLADRVGGSVSLGMRDRLQMVYVESSRGHESSAFRPDIGGSLPMLTTAMGRAWLCQAPQAQRETALDALRAADAEQWHSQQAGWEEARRTFAAHGYCACEAAWLNDVYAVAVPMRQAVDGETLVFNCGVPRARLTPGKLEREMAPLLLHMVREIEAELERP
ncbi:HTH-type transcriptional regulator TsaQ1/TsaQ2 [Paraburkholderia caffeinitolerans]|uniref:HTH-type transcriptional regulator TsaQ1/TsaQ2 n=1 Tax=Paraburkholderia caffeinitolerans TaxID=1723730 RepID=A0A6J5FH38_9BURK|nr:MULTISPECIES: IclR family transcriptional regulator [Paraburkholderia]CAB3777559.1 HTH-type transcriptional regulator TsaQ1/TsaQ2 [Paraburkholderia caffeinitolerans]